MGEHLRPGLKELSGVLAVAWLGIWGMLAGDQLLYSWYEARETRQPPRLPIVVRLIADSPTPVESTRARRLLASVDQATLTPLQWRLWLRTMGDAIARNLVYTSPDQYQKQYRYAVRCYREALVGETLPVRRWQTQLRLARLFAQNQDWPAAAAEFAAIDIQRLSPMQQAEVYLEWGACLRHSGDTKGALGRLDAVIAGGDWTRREQALVAKLQLLLHLSESLPVEHPARWFHLRDANWILEELALQPDISVAARRARDLCICRLARLRGDYPQVVQAVGTLHRSGAAIAYKLEGLAVLSQSIRDAGQWQDSRFVMDACLDDYRGYEQAARILADLLAAQLDQLSATLSLEILVEMLDRFDSPETCQLVLAAMVDERSGFENQLAGAEPVVLRDAMGAIQYRLERKQKPEWAPVLGLFWYLRGKVAMAEGEVKAAEQAFGRFLVALPESPYRSQAIYLDLCAAGEQTDTSPAVIALRAVRLLADHPDHPNAANALHDLAFAYHRMQLNRESLEVVKTSFLQSVVHLTRQRQTVTQQQWLRTIGGIITGYSSLGYNEKADRLYKMYSPYLVELPDTGDVLAAAARCAAEEGQLHEAIRRYDLAIPRCADARSALALKVSRQSLALRIDSPGAVSRTQTLLRELRDLPEQEQQEIAWAIRQLQHGLLVYLEPRDFDQMLAVMEEIHVAPGDETWFSAWLLRVMWQNLQTEDLASWRSRYDQIIQAADARPPPDAMTTAFLRRQVALIEGLIAVNNRLDILEQRGLTP